MNLAEIRAQKEHLASLVGDDVKRAARDILTRYESDFRKLAKQ